MKRLNICQVHLFILLGCFTLTSLAWNNSIDIGYGYSHDPNNSKYNNSGILLTGDLISLGRSPLTYWSFNGALGRWHSTAPRNKNVTTAALAIALRFYPLTESDYPPYLLGSVGPAYLSSRQFGKNTQAKHLAFQTNLGLGIEFNCVDVNLRLSHYSNANLSKPNQGFNILYLLSIGYLI